MIAVLLALAIASSPALGLAAGTCRTPEPGPAILIQAEGLRDRAGRIRAELYPANDADFLADDNLLIEAHKTFARTDTPVPASGPVTVCIRVPRAGRYALSLLHDRDGDHKFGLSSDGIGFAGNPKLGWSKPRAADAAVTAGAGMTHIAIMLNYRHGLGMRPERDR